mgnify:CR=1 FL=1
MLIITVLPLYSAVSSHVKAEHPHHGHATDVVVVNVMEVFQALQEVQDLIKNLQNMVMKKVESIKKLEQEVIERERSFSMKSKNLTAEARERERMEIERLKNEIRIQAQSIEAKQQEEQILIQQKMADKVKDYCKLMGWKIVIPGALYADPSVDKTRVVIDGMNKEYEKKKEVKKAAKS